ncbi:MAG: hypothetical protein AVDCRST_MAG77-5796 [uncultured Chloroflexi bacterium]|uniref:Uncharacterized protein n=1 Tax=uncultured Chloroflexota bacterium TaxID=166587 RepID=A0A6J4KEA4_9CHLR|nr:MAG: hypothetical protein AVDCRST_MAG77-5796 [uncultured Chloroflexota bacterium]
MREKATDRTGGAASDTDARVMLCSWCAERGGLLAVVRPIGEEAWGQAQAWAPVSHACARVATQAQLASHGICPDCLAWQLREINATVSHDVR